MIPDWTPRTSDHSENEPPEMSAAIRAAIMCIESTSSGNKTN